MPSAPSRRGIAALLLVGSLVAACGEQSTSSGTAAEPSDSTDAGWTSVIVDTEELEDWDPVFTDVTIASRTEVAAIDDRVARAAERPYTTVYGMDGLVYEVAHTPAHSRVAVSTLFGADVMQVHLAPDGSSRPTGFLDLAGHAVVAVCPADYEICIDPNADDGNEEQSPHMFDNFTDTFYFYALLAAGPSLQSSALGEMPRADGDLVWGTAVAESPYGALDCVLAGEDKSAVSSLDGEQVFSGGSFEDPLTTTTETSHTARACVDRRGLVIRSTAEVRGWTRFEPGVDGPVDELPWPLRD